MNNKLYNNMQEMNAISFREHFSIHTDTTIKKMGLKLSSVSRKFHRKTLLQDNSVFKYEQ